MAEGLSVKPFRAITWSDVGGREAALIQRCAAHDEDACAELDNEHDPNAVGIWDDGRRLQAGYVPAEVAAGLDAAAWQAVSIHEFFEDGRRVGLRVLLAPQDAWIGTPRA